MPTPTRSRAPKKARWSTAQKAAAKAGSRRADATRKTTGRTAAGRTSAAGSDATRQTTARTDAGRKTTVRSDAGRKTTVRSDAGRKTTVRSDAGRKTTVRSDAGRKTTVRSDAGRGITARADVTTATPHRDREPRHAAPARAERSTRSAHVPAARETRAATPKRVVASGSSDAGQPTFADLGLPTEILQRLARDDIHIPFPIQAVTIPDALAGRDVLGRARTGSGKTLAFGLAMLARLAATANRRRPGRPRAIVLAPTRELAMQVSDALQPYVHVLGLRHKVVAGGLPYAPQLAALERGLDLLVATPGRLLDLRGRGALDLGGVEIVVVDEADHMAQMGFLPDLTEILDEVPPGGQRLLFSATLDDGVDEVVAKYLREPVTHAPDLGEAAVTTMAHHLVLVAPHDKKGMTADLANRPGRTLVFVRTKLGADRVAAQLRESGVLAAALHGGLGQGVRNRVLAAFRSGELPVLVATDVAARGIHVDDVSVVLQVDPPADHKDYLHRAGRTARAGAAGVVLTLVLPHQRRPVERLLQAAGLPAEPTATDRQSALNLLPDARPADGVPVPAATLHRLLEGDRTRRGPAGPSGPRHRRDGAPRTPRGSSDRRRGEARDDKPESRHSGSAAPSSGRIGTWAPSTSRGNSSPRPHRSKARSSGAR